MITLDSHTESELEHIAQEQGISVTQLIKDFIVEYKSEREALRRAEDSYQEFLRTGKSVSLEQLMEDNGLDD